MEWRRTFFEYSRNMRKYTWTRIEAPPIFFALCVIYTRTRLRSTEHRTVSRSFSHSVKRSSVRIFARILSSISFELVLYLLSSNRVEVNFKGFCEILYTIVSFPSLSESLRIVLLKALASCQWHALFSYRERHAVFTPIRFHLDHFFRDCISLS